jgi:predicted naringenin-chalcone synthase
MYAAMCRQTPPIVAVSGIYPERLRHQMGNLSSVSVLNVLEEAITRRRPPEREPGLLMALGPRFSAELVLLRW